MTDAQQNTHETASILTVFADGHVFGLDVKDASTIFKAGSITPIPLARKDVCGFINLRGRITVAVSLRRRLGLDETGQECEKFAAGIEAAHEYFALLVDRVGEVIALPASARAEIPADFTGRPSLFMRDLYVHGSQHIPILDVSRLFDFSL